MGPRFRKRGNSRADGVHVSHHVSLQWGRAFGSAEIVSSLTDDSRHVSLQWGRAFGSAETRVRARISADRACASMGPRFRKRGNRSCRLALTLTIRLASMGPRFRKRGNVDRRRSIARRRWSLQWGRAFGSAETCSRFRQSHRHALASMGPRFRKRGNSTARCRQCAPLSRFNGAALSEARKPT